MYSVEPATTYTDVPSERRSTSGSWVAYREGNPTEAETHVARIVGVHGGDDEIGLPLSTAETIDHARRLSSTAPHEQPTYARSQLGCGDTDGTISTAVASNHQC